MIPLPVCSLRGEAVGDGFLCSSPFIQHVGGVAPSVVCTKCPYPNVTCSDRPGHPACKPRPELPLPPTGTQIASFLSSVASHLVNGLPQVDQETMEARLALCDSCDKLRHSDKRCAMCGCFVSVKARWKGEKCPEGKW